MITVKVDTESGEPPPISAEVVTSLVRLALMEGGGEASQIQVVFADDEYLRRLKRQFFGQDHYTDVIAFQLNEPDEVLEGEIYISQERALENSRLYQEPYSKELMRLVAHGCLHLTGHKDDTPEEQANMRVMENRILDLVSDPC